LPPAFIVVGPLALVLGVVTVGVTLPVERGAQYTARVALELVVAGGFVAAALYVLAGGRARWFGLLAAGVAGGLCLETWRFSDRPLAYTAGLLFGSLWSAPLLHMVLAFPSGLLRGRWERLFVAGSYTAAIVIQPIPFLFWEEPFRPVCEECPSNLALARADQEVAEVAMAAFLGLGTLAMLLLAAYLVRRVQTAHAHQRSVLLPVAVSMGATLLLTAVSAGAEARGDIEFAQATNLAYLVAFAAVPVAMLTGVLRSRAYRAEAVSGLVERLESPLGPHGLRDALAYALDDPTLEVGYWVPEQERHVDGHGRVVAAAPTPGRTWTAIERAGRPVALIGHDSRLDEDVELVESTGAAVGLALERERLAAALRANVNELRASRARLVEASDAARRRFERDLHDGAQPRLVSLLLNVNLARRNAEGNGAATLLDEIDTELRGILAELRAVASGLLPPALTDLGLEAAVTELAARMPFRVDVGLPTGRLPDRVEVTAYFIIAEALTNAAKHAHPTRVDVRMTLADDRAFLEVRDDGAGGANASGGSGLRGLQDRVDVLEGRLTVSSSAGVGTTVRVDLPCAL